MTPLGLTSTIPFRGSVEGRAKQLLRLAQGPLAGQAVADVAHGSGGEVPRLGADWTEGNLDGEQRSIAAPGLQRQAGPHRPKARAGGEVLVMNHMAIALRLGHQDLDGLSQEFVLGVAKQLQGTLADKQDRRAASTRNKPSGAASAGYGRSTLPPVV